MAPGTRQPHDRDVFPQFQANGDDFVDMMNNLEDVPALDAWEVPGDEQIMVLEQSFEDAFADAPNPITAKADTATASYESNNDYLTYLELKLQKVESRRKNVEKLTARDMLSSLEDTKETQFNWNMQQGISSSEDETIDSDISGTSGHSLSKELRRKMFPEQHALNETEILHLVEHDVIQKIFSKLDENQEHK